MPPTVTTGMRSSGQHLFDSAAKILSEFSPNKRYLVGVSGGRDSVALFHLLQSSGYRNLIICHLDHQLRGRAANADARFVRQIAQIAGFEVEIGTTDVRELAKQSKVSIETAARIARFAFFIAVARRRRCRTVFLAHHADDLTETALLNFFRGVGPGGIAAMRPISSYHVGKTALTLVRPLLGVWRSEIDQYVNQYGLRFREDSTNTDLNATRNRIRLRVLPYIEKQFGRNVRRSIWRAAEISSEEHSVLESMIEIGAFDGRELKAQVVRELPVGLQRRAIIRWLRGRHVPDVGFELVESVRALLQPNAPVAKVNLPRGGFARRRSGKLFIE